VGCLALYAVVLIVLVNAGPFVRVMTVPVSSMEPTIHTGDTIVVLRRWVMGRVQRGDAVIFRMPFTRELSVKRIVAVGGDRLHLSNGQLFLNGHAVRETYVEHIAATADDYRDNFPAGAPEFVPYPRALDQIRGEVRNGELFVPPGHYFALGDNRDYSLDSRYVGCVPDDDVVGRPFYVSASRTGARMIPRVRIGQ